MKFRIGDKIRCIDSTAREELETGKIYTVESIYDSKHQIGQFVTFNRRGEVFREERFELADSVIFNEMVDNYYGV